MKKTELVQRQVVFEAPVGVQIGTGGQTGELAEVSVQMGLIVVAVDQSNLRPVQLGPGVWSSYQAVQPPSTAMIAPVT